MTSTLCRVGLVSALTCLLFVPACRTDTGTDEGGAPAGRPVTKESGFSLALPEGWVEVDELPASEIDALVANNPAVAGFVAQARGTLMQAGNLFALDRRDRGRTNVNVVVTPASASLDELERTVPGRLETELSARNVRAERTMLGGRDALRVTYDFALNAPSGPVTLTGRQYHVTADGNLFVMTLTGSGPELDAITRSFRLT